MRSSLSALMGLVVLGAAASASANVVTVHFNGTDGASSSLFYNAGSPSFQANEGGASGQMTLMVPRSDEAWFAIGLFKFTLPADMVGATINSAQFKIRESWWNGAINGYEIRRISSTVAWNPGDGALNSRWTWANGVNNYFADYNKTTGQGVAWDGTTRWNGDTAGGVFATTAMGSEVITTGNIAGGGVGTFDVTSLISNFAAGTWNNNGFVLSALNGSGTASQRLSTLGANDGLIIDYTPAPVPEPAVIGVLTAGSLVMLRRRRRTA